MADYTDIHSVAIDAAGNDITDNGAWHDERAPFGDRPSSPTWPELHRIGADRVVFGFAG